MPDLARLSTEHRAALLGCVKRKTAKGVPPQRAYSECSRSLGLEKVVILQKQGFEDPAERVEKLVEKWTSVLRNRFLIMVSKIKDSNTLEELADLILTGRVEQALALGESHVAAFASSINQAFIDAGQSTAEFLQSRNIIVNFDVSNFRAVQIMRENRLQFIREITDDLRVTINQALSRGLEQGLNPRDTARLFRDSIGLTAKQERAVANYRQLLSENSSEALTRKLRDRRFDRSFTRAVERGRPLTGEQIDRMVGRYRDRYIKYRSEVIARTETLPTVHQGVDEMYDQAVEDGTLKAEEILQIWHVGSDGRERDSHRKMRNQTRRHGELFQSGLGNLLAYPGDRRAPIADRAQCRCVKSTRIQGA